MAAAGSLTGLYLDVQRYGPDPAVLGAPDDSLAAPFAAPVLQLAAYFSGQLTRFDLPIEPPGTPFQQQVWKTMRDIPYGQTMTYGQLAARLGRPGAGQAVGAANGRNPVFIMVPCHRLIGADGRLRGHGTGIAHKQFLLRLEQQAADATSIPGPA
ncbi:MAG TPA: methylated-DNA--[protein]-cysteine S-methyltransferase [Trebonia sp.]